jgi:hypothetical protein
MAKSPAVDFNIDPKALKNAQEELDRIKLKKKGKATPHK